MPGQFSKANRPKRPGAYVNFDATLPDQVPISVGSIVAVPFTHDWGPFKEAVLVASLSEFQAVYGYTTNSPGFRAVKQAFQGEGLPGRGGAGAVLCYRFGATAAAKASLILDTKITLTALYQGTRGNNLRATVQAKAGDATRDELILLDGTVEVERYAYLKVNITDLAAQINASSAWVVASNVTSGVAIAPVVASPFTGGLDGGTLLGADWTAALSALEVERFGVVAPFELTDSTMVASFKTWAANLNLSGNRFVAVLGGLLNETVSTAITDAALLNNENIVRVGNGSVEDSDMLDVNGNPTILSTAQLAPRIAGIIAQKGESKSMTFSRLAGLKLLNGPTDAQVLSAFDGGVVLLTRDSNVDAPVRIERGLTTFLQASQTLSKPHVIFRNPKFVRTMQGIEMELAEWAEANVIGQLPVGNKTRDFVLGHTKAMLTVREAAEIVLPGWTVEVDPDPPPTDLDEFVAVKIGLRFGRSTEQVFFTIKVA